MTEKYSQIKPIPVKNRKWPDNELSECPIWCAVDLRDGNQALANPLTMNQKIEYFQLLLDIGFKQIEVGFPSASKDDFDFCRYIIDNNMVPDDVLISVLAPARKSLIKTTMESLKGLKKALVHIYIATSELHREFVLSKSEEETLGMIVESVKYVKELASDAPETEFNLEFSPEEFTDTDLDYSVEICNAVINAWEPKEGERVILNLPATVERRPPTHYADMIEYFIEKLNNPKGLISLHAHNDMGCAVASTEMALMAGAERVEGTLFGHGERSGNVDLVTLVLNHQYLGINTGLDFQNLMEISEKVAELTSMKPHERHPYAGELVFTAFSGSHQDAIHKCLSKKDELKEYFGRWKIPYLHIDPSDLGRNFEKFIRINSQSGKGGIAHVMDIEHNLKLPNFIQVDLAKKVQNLAEGVAREVNGAELWDIFVNAYVSPKTTIQLVNYWPNPCKENPSEIDAELHIELNGEVIKLQARDNGPISAFVKALKQLDIPDFSLAHYEEDSIGKTAKAEAVSSVYISSGEEHYIGVGFHSNIDQAAVNAVIAAVNNMIAQSAK